MSSSSTSSTPADQTNRGRIWTLLIVPTALFMVVLDTLVVNVALPSIHRDLGSSIQSLEWTVNAYVLAYAVFLLTGAALGDRFGRKRMFLLAITLFTVSSAAAALAPTSDTLIAARAMQGVGAAIGTPLTLTLIAAFIAYELRARAPMLAMGFFAKRSFAVTNGISLAMYFGMFGSIFFLSQYLQNVLHNSPLQAGVKLLAWTGATMVVSPLAGIFSERFGSRL